MGKYISLVEKNGYEYVKRIGNRGAVVVIPIWVKGDIVKYQFIINNRPTFDKPILEFPAGLIDEGEIIEQTALRELKEETGWNNASIIKDEWSKYNTPSSAGLLTEVLNFVSVDISHATLTSQSLDPNEKIKVLPLMSINELILFIRLNKDKLLVSSRIMTFLLRYTNSSKLDLGLDIHGVLTQQDKMNKFLYENKDNYNYHVISGAPVSEMQKELALLGYDLMLFKSFNSIIDHLKITHTGGKIWKSTTGWWCENADDWWLSKSEIADKLKLDFLLDDRLKYQQDYLTHRFLDIAKYVI